MQATFYHSLLRISSLTLALVLLFDSGIVTPFTKELSDNTGSYLASAIGMSASVTPTELNSITADLTAQQQRLNEREAALSEREIAVGLNAGSTNAAGGLDLSTFILSVILFILLVLILLNYLLDYLRRTPKITPQPSS